MSKQANHGYPQQCVQRRTKSPISGIKGNKPKREQSGRLRQLFSVDGTAFEVSQTWDQIFVLLGISCVRPDRLLFEPQIDALVFQIGMIMPRSKNGVEIKISHMLDDQLMLCINCFISYFIFLKIPKQVTTSRLSQVISIYKDD